MRGVGQTQNMIDNLPDERCVVVSHTESVSRGIKQRVQEERGKEFAKRIKFISISSFEDLIKLRGLSVPVFFDHYFFIANEEEIVKQALSSAHTSSIVRSLGKIK